MSERARVAIVGGGIMGVSLLYHLAKLGWQDVVLLEKTELTAGSTWHAAGLCTHFAHNPTIMEMRASSVRLYRDRLPAEVGRDIGFHPCGALRVTRSPERMDEFRQVRGLGRFMGHEFRILSPDELAEVYPLCTLDGIVGAIHEPFDGHADPSQATQALAERARAMGARIDRHRPVTAIERRSNGEWLLSTDKGEILAQQIVNAAGTWCREIGQMMGVDLPVVPMLHQYLVTDRVEAVARRQESGLAELPIIRDPEESWYLRQERDGFICGPYEKEPQPWSLDGVPPEFGMELLPPDLERVEGIVAMAMERVPALAEAGIKTIVNGPITFTPDANPLVGPAFGLPNAWLLTGSSMGVMEGGGAGAFLARWIVEGAPPMDALAVDPRRFGGYADRAYRLEKAVECFGLQFGIHYPFEERPAARGKRVTPLYARQETAGAVFGSAYGWERPNWFSSGKAEEAPLTFRRPAWFDAVADECRTVAGAVGLADLSAFAKFEISGQGAAAFMEGLGAKPPPRKLGRLGLMHVLAPSGGIDSEFTVTRLADERFYLTSAAAAERHDEQLLRERSATLSDVMIRNRTEEIGILAVMGPKARDLLQPLAELELDEVTFPWLSARHLRVAGLPLRALRVSYVGELGWELHAPLARLAELYDALVEAGRPLGLGHFGAYAMNAMRLEKGYPAWGSDLTSERTPLESGLAAFVRYEGREFIGREAMLRRAGRPDSWRLVLLALEEGADPFAMHPVMSDASPVGIVTSAAYGHRVGQYLALAYLTPEASGREDNLSVEVLGRPVAARIVSQPPYDPKNRKPAGSDRAI